MYADKTRKQIYMFKYNFHFRMGFISRGLITGNINSIKNRELYDA